MTNNHFTLGVLVGAAVATMLVGCKPEPAPVPAVAPPSVGVEEPAPSPVPTPW